jgi:hypothetical protein
MDASIYILSKQQTSSIRCVPATIMTAIFTGQREISGIFIGVIKIQI